MSVASWLSLSCPPSWNRAATFLAWSRLSSQAACAFCTPSGFSYWMIMSFSYWRMLPISPRSSAMALTSEKEWPMNSSLIAWMRNMPSMPAPPSSPSSDSTTAMAPSMRTRMVNPRMSESNFMIAFLNPPDR